MTFGPGGGTCGLKGGPPGGFGGPGGGGFGGPGGYVGKVTAGIPPGTEYTVAT